MAGLLFEKKDIEYAAGTIAFNLRKEYERAVVLNQRIQALTDAEWTALGISNADRDVYKAAYADLAYQKAQSFDSSANVKQLWGLGV